MHPQCDVPSLFACPGHCTTWLHPRVELFSGLDNRSMKSASFITVTMMIAHSAAAEAASLLDGLLADAPALSTSLTNVAHNLGMVEGEFLLKTERSFVAISASLDEASASRTKLGAGLRVYFAGMQADALNILDPLSVDVGESLTTAVGSIQAADLTALFDASGVTERVFAQAGAISASVDANASVTEPAALQNVSLNSGLVAGYVDVLLQDTGLRADTIATTAIGALQNGALLTTVDLDATVRGQVGAISDATALVVAALVGA